MAAVRHGHLHMRSRFGQLGVRAQLSHQRVVVDGILDHSRLVVARDEPLQTVLVRVEAHAALLHRVPRTRGTHRAKRQARERYGRRPSKAAAR